MFLPIFPATINGTFVSGHTTPSMAVPAMVKTKNAMGFCTSKGKVKISVTLDASMFDRLRERACREGKSIAAKIREHVECGVEVDGWEDQEAQALPEQPCIVDISRTPGLESALIESGKYATRAVR